MNEFLEEVNDLIQRRIVYGHYVVTASKPSSILVWSNSSEYWYINELKGRVKAGQTLELDANQILVPGSKRDIKEVLPHLDSLPLYSSGSRGGSSEFKEWRIPSDDNN